MTHFLSLLPLAVRAQESASGWRLTAWKVAALVVTWVALAMLIEAVLTWRGW